MELGLIGLGRMGAHMARRWREAGLTVIGYARHASAVQARLSAMRFEFGGHLEKPATQGAS